MRLEGRGERLTIFVGETDQHGHRPLYTEIVERAQQAGLAGATVLRGIEGFGASSHIHTTRILRLSEDLPVVVVIVDQTERIEAFLPVLDELVTEGLVVREEVEIVTYRGRGGGC
jgi:PII-like signaling protein